MTSIVGLGSEEGLRHRPVVEAVMRGAFARKEEYRAFAIEAPRLSSGQVDFLFASAEEGHEPGDIFRRLRWGGQFVFCSVQAREVEEVAKRFAGHGFEVETLPTYVREGRQGWMRWVWMGRRVYYFVARKVNLIPPGETTERFTYDVRLVWDEKLGEHVVVKSVPTLESVVGRLRKRFPEVREQVLENKGRKFTERIFPLFITRETAMLQILQKGLPKPYDKRIPRAIDVEKDERGFVRRFTMNWLRNGSRPISQLEFARQSADLLHIVHDQVGVIHLDLRLDNFVITDTGVGFVDFGSSVRVGEDLKQNPLLGQLFDELMHTSQIQVMLERMTTSGMVTSQAIKNGYKKVDKAVDFFYLALQISQPHSNPELKPLIRYEPGSASARELAKLTQEILKPTDPANPPYRSALDILRGIIAIKDYVKEG
ncbi:MAG TPA: hypothetical protein VFE58_10090 [Tepidisphaeraceae bacterium]|jgi:hypothetical protein|nr:hypothetical protein [Tepidisphaeraceae bacterium]